MEVYSFIVFFVYMGLLIYIIPASGLQFDLYERKFRLFPGWFKIIAFSWLIVSFILILVYKNSIERWEELLLSNINISLFILFFSKQKYEDEFAEQIRFKSFTYSFVSVVAMVGAFSALNITKTEGGWSNFLLHGLIGAGLLISTLHFYITVYKLKKENN